MLKQMSNTDRHKTQTDRQTDRHRQTNRQTDRQAGRQTDRQTDRVKEKSNDLGSKHLTVQSKAAAIASSNVKSKLILQTATTSSLM